MVVTASVYFEGENMKVWIVCEGEDLPIDNGARLMRMGMLFEYLVRHGYDVIWWTSTFRHGEKKHRYFENRSYRDKQGCIKLLYPGAGYKKNVSVKRIIYCKKIANALEKAIQYEEKPDVILCAWPIPEMAEVMVKYGKEYKVPTCIDIRDLWPDIFITPFPKIVQPIASLLINPIIRSASKTLGLAYGFLAMADYGIKWGCIKADRPAGIHDQCIYIGNEKVKQSIDNYQSEIKWWAEKGVQQSDWIICFFSALSKRNRDIETVIKAVIEMSVTYPNIKFVIGGRGDDEDYFKEVCKESTNVIFGGWLNNKQMNSLMLMSKVGAYCMNDEMFSHGFGNKPIQYISASLPILNSMRGYPERYIQKNGIGLTYEVGNVDSCKAKIELFITNESMRREMSSNANACFEKDYEVERVNSKFEQYLINVVADYNRR